MKFNKKVEENAGIEVNVTICVYDFDNSKYRFVFFFYKKDETKPTHKWIYYLVGENLDELKEKYLEEVKSHDFIVNDKINLCSCTKDTVTNVIKIPNNLKYKFLYKNVIENDLKDKMGNDVLDKYEMKNAATGIFDEATGEEIEGTLTVKKTVVTYQQILIPKPFYQNIEKIIKELGLTVKTFSSIPSHIYSYHKKCYKDKNQIVVYNEANFILIIGFVRNRIVNSIFVENVNKVKDESGELVKLHLHKISNLLASIIWQCQKEGAIIERGIIISNSERNVENILKNENIFRTNFEIINNTETIFGDFDEIPENNEEVFEQVEETINEKINVKETVEAEPKEKQTSFLTKVKQKLFSKNKTIKKGFTIIETVVAVGVLATIVSVVAAIYIEANSLNKNAINLSKVNIYIDNVREIMENVEGEEILPRLTSYSLGIGEEEKSGTYYISHNAEITPLNESEDGFIIDFIYKQEAISLNYVSYSFTINELKAVNTKLKLIDNLTIEVVK